MPTHQDPKAPEEPAIVYDRVGYRYNASGPGALEDVSLTVRAGERLGILGPNGGGKSTLIKLTLGLLSGHEGRISVFGLTPHEARARRLIGYVPQRSEAELAFPLSGRDVVSMTASVGLRPWERLRGERADRVERALELVDARVFAEKPIGTLSGGQVQRVMIARALAGNPKLLLMDEPTVGIDPAGQKQFAAFLTSLVGRLGLTLVIVSHDLRTIAAGCDRVACLARTLHAHTSPQGLTPNVLAEVFRHDVAAIFGDLHVDAHSARGCNDPTHRH
jgi:zinc transport system ATP-binding protein